MATRSFKDELKSNVKQGMRDAVNTFIPKKPLEALGWKKPRNEWMEAAKELKQRFKNARAEFNKPSTKKVAMNTAKNRMK